MNDLDSKSFYSLFISYLCSLGAFALQHASAILSCLAAVTAIVASFYAYRVNRMKMRHMQARDESICLRCVDNVGDSPSPYDCPFLVNHRPSYCRLKEAKL